MAEERKTKSNAQNTGAHKNKTSRPNDEPLDELTQSQRQNRLGKGRAKNGSDGSSNGGRGSNH